MIDLNEITERVLKMRRGELPPNAVSTEELREAVSLQRKAFADSQEKKDAKASGAKAKKQSTMDFDFGGTGTGSNNESLF